MRKRIIAMIPARMGSKRVPKKNLRYLGEKPLIIYPIELAKNSNLFESVWVNTESTLLGETAVKNDVFFHKRPDGLAGDQATNREFTYEFLSKHECDYVVMVNPTSPMIKQDTLYKFVQFIENNNFDTVLSVVEEKTECFYRDKAINFPLSEKINSQFLVPVHRTVWCLTAWKRSMFMAYQESGKNPVFGGKIGLFSIPKDEAVDIDTEEDWKLAEGILASRKEIATPHYLGEENE